MVKAKWRLALAVFLATVAIILLAKLSLHGSRSFTVDEYGHAGQGIQLRNLKQPFNWHEDQEMAADGAGGGAGGEEAGRGAQSKNETSKHEMSTCRNSVQGKMIIADDKGFVCHRNDVLQSGCCHENATSSRRYSCDGCSESSGCCKVYEHCISCCMDPKRKPVLMNVLNEANALKNILLLSVSDHFELCLAKCRTSSSSVHHENVYINPMDKFCFSKGPASHSEEEKS